MDNSVRLMNIEELASTLGGALWGTREFLVFVGRIPQTKSESPFRQTYLSFFLLESGSVKCTLNLENWEIKKNDLLFLSSDQVIEVQSVSKLARGKLIAVDSSYLDAELFHLPLLLKAPSVISLSSEEAKMASDLIEMMKVRLEAGNGPNRRQVALNLISAFLFETSAFYNSRSGEREKRLSSSEIIHQHFHSLLVANFARKRSVKFYADQLGISPRYLTQLTKEITGKPASDIIVEMVILEAKILLRNPEMTIKKVAEGLNFSDQFSFSKYFKKVTDLTPTQFRNLS